jgi:GAF domain-containing protein
MNFKDDHERLASHYVRVRCHQDILCAFAGGAPRFTELDPLLKHAARQMARGTGVERAKIMCCRPAESDLLIVAGVGWKEGVVGHCRIGTDIGSPPGRCLYRRQILNVADIRQAEDLRWEPVLQEHGVVASLNAPILLDEEPWGVMEVDGEVPGKFDQQDEAFIETFALLLGAAVANVRLLEAKRQA